MRMRIGIVLIVVGLILIAIGIWLSVPHPPAVEPVIYPYYHHIYSHLL